MLVSVVWDFLNQKESQNKKYLLEMNTKKYIQVHVYASNCMARFNAEFFCLNIFFFTIIALKSLLRNIFMFLSPSSFVDWLSDLPFINVYSFWLAEQNIKIFALQVEPCSYTNLKYTCSIFQHSFIHYVIWNKWMSYIKTKGGQEGSLTPIGQMEPRSLSPAFSLMAWP